MNVQQRIDQARHDAASARSQVVALSSARLKLVLAMPPKQASQYRQDPQLIATDRALLNQRLTNALPHWSLKAITWRLRMLKAWQWIARRPRVTAVTAIVLFFAGTAWWHTPHQLGYARLTHDLIIEWNGPGGDRRAQTLPIGSAVDVVGQDGQRWLIRAWLDTKGYYTAELDPNDLTFDR